MVDSAQPDGRFRAPDAPPTGPPARRTRPGRPPPRRTPPARAPPDRTPPARPPPDRPPDPGPDPQHTSSPPTTCRTGKHAGQHVTRPVPNPESVPSVPGPCRKVCRTSSSMPGDHPARTTLVVSATHRGGNGHPRPTISSGANTASGAGDSGEVPAAPPMRSEGVEETDPDRRLKARGTSERSEDQPAGHVRAERGPANRTPPATPGAASGRGSRRGWSARRRGA